MEGFWSKHPGACGLPQGHPGGLIDAFEGSVYNIHPALLPAFGGKGMYGIHAHRAVIASGDTTSGLSIHKVTEVVR